MAQHCQRHMTAGETKCKVKKDQPAEIQSPRLQMQKAALLVKQQHCLLFFPDDTLNAKRCADILSKYCLCFWWCNPYKCTRMFNVQLQYQTKCRQSKVKECWAGIRKEEPNHQICGEVKVTFNMPIMGSDSKWNKLLW